MVLHRDFLEDFLVACLGFLFAESRLDFLGFLLDSAIFA